MDKGNVFIISGPSGSGKDTILAELFKRCPELMFSISSVTRDMREGEKEGEKYNFVARETFEKMIEEDQLLEYNIYIDNYYGTPRKPVEAAINSGRDIFIEVDVNGAANIRKKMQEAISIFIMPPSFEELKRRLYGRSTEPKKVIDRRMESALEEIKRADEYDYIVINDDLTQAVCDVIAVIHSRRLEVNRQKHIIEEVLKDVES